MGLLASTITKSYLIAYQNELEYKISLITQSKLGLTSSQDELLNVGTDMDPENPMVKQLEQRKERLNLLEKKLDMQLADYRTKLEMVNKNLEAAEKMEDKAIERLNK